MLCLSYVCTYDEQVSGLSSLSYALCVGADWRFASNEVWGRLYTKKQKEKKALNIIIRTYMILMMRILVNNCDKPGKKP